MPNDLFSDQAQERPDPSSPTGRKIVYEDEPSDEEVPTLADGRFDGRGPWSQSEINKPILSGEGFTHNELALWALYAEERITVRRFADICQEKTGKPTFKLRARIADIRQIERAPPIKTDEDAEPTEWYIPKADTEQ